MAGFIAFSQFLNYDENEPAGFLKRILLPMVAALAVTIVFLLTGVVTRFNLLLFLFFILFALASVLGNALFRLSRPRNWPGIVTHLGFALFLLGVLITFSNSKTITRNTSRFDLGSRQSNRENLLLMRGDTLYMSGYYVTYVSREQKGNLTEYRVDFLKKKKGKHQLEFTLHPSVNAHPRMGAVYNPDTRHYIGRDYYTYISSVSADPDYIVIKTIMNPYINVLWAGSFIMMAGIGWALVRRIRLSGHA